MRIFVFLSAITIAALPLKADAQYQYNPQPGQYEQDDEAPPPYEKPAPYQQYQYQPPRETPMVRPQHVAPSRTERSEPSGTTVRPQDFSGRPDAAAIDENRLLKNRIMSLRKSVVALQSRVATLEEQLRRMSSRSTFECRDVGTSANGAGDTESCAPYACNYIDGRCREQCATSDQCAPGFLCDIPARQCVPPPPPAADDDDSWWPF